MKKHFSHRLIPAFLILTMLLLTACSSNNTNVENSNFESSAVSESSTTPESSLLSEDTFDLSAYTTLIEESRQVINETFILLSNVGNYEYNYWETLNNINGTMNYENMVDGAFKWLSENADTSREEIAQSYSTIQDQYKEIILIEIGTNSTASTLKSEYDTLFTNFDSFYNLITNPSGSINSFATHFNTYLEAIKSSNSKLELLTRE